MSEVLSVSELDGVDSVRFGVGSLCHHARPGEVELLHKVQAGVQAQRRVLHTTKSHQSRQC